MPLPDSVVLRFVSAISTAERHLQAVAEGHEKDFLNTLAARYGPEEAGRGWLDEGPYLRFLITTYAGQFYGTMTRAIKAMKKPPKRPNGGAKRRWVLPLRRGVGIFR